MFAMSRRQYIILSVLVVLAVAPTLAFAASGLVPIVPQDCNKAGGCSSVCDLAQLAQNILNDAIFFAVFLAAILFVWAGFKMLSSPANPGQMQKGKNLFYSVLIGFLIILGAWLVINAFMSIMVSGSIGAPWNKLC